MRRGLPFGTVFFCACAGPPAQLKPPPDWVKDAPVVVEGPKTISFKNWAHLEDRVKVKASAEDDLRALGFKVLARAQGQGEFTLELRAIDFRNTSAAATRDGEVLDQFEFATTDQPCWSMFGPNMPENLRCTARAMVQASRKRAAGNSKSARASAKSTPAGASARTRSSAARTRSSAARSRRWARATS